jgi:hypothetical protein
LTRPPGSQIMPAAGGREPWLCGIMRLCGPGWRASLGQGVRAAVAAGGQARCSQPYLGPRDTWLGSR